MSYESTQGVPTRFTVGSSCVTTNKQIIRARAQGTAALLAACIRGKPLQDLVWLRDRQVGGRTNMADLGTRQARQLKGSVATSS